MHLQMSVWMQLCTLADPSRSSRKRNAHILSTALCILDKEDLGGGKDTGAGAAGLGVSLDKVLAIPEAGFALGKEGPTQSPPVLTGCLSLRPLQGMKGPGT
jgi:hypothetical protein